MSIIRSTCCECITTKYTYTGKIYTTTECSFYYFMIVDVRSNREICIVTIITLIINEFLIVTEILAIIVLLLIKYQYIHKYRSRTRPTDSCSITKRQLFFEIDWLNKNNKQIRYSNMKILRRTYVCCFRPSDEHYGNVTLDKSKPRHLERV